MYSEFAGCCTDFKGALIVNPYDADKVAESIHVALTMSNTAKQVGREEPSLDTQPEKEAHGCLPGCLAHAACCCLCGWCLCCGV